MKKWVITALILFFAIYFFTGGSDKTKSVNYNNGQFKNLTGDSSGYGQVLTDGLKLVFSSGSLTPKTNPPVVRTTASYFLSGIGDRLQAVWGGQSSVLIKYKDLKILTDPMFSDNVLSVNLPGTKRFERYSPLYTTGTGFIDAVIISHNHRDHLDKKAILSLKDRTAMFIVPLGLRQTLIDWGVDPLRVVELDWGQSVSMPGVRITSTPAAHMSGRGLFDYDKTFWSSFVIDFGDKRVFFSGDTAYTNSMKRIGQNFGPFDLVLADIGGCKADSQKFRMSPEDAIKAFHDLKGRAIVPINWGTFAIPDVHWTEPVNRFVSEAKKQHIRYGVPIQGEPFDAGGRLPVYDWWSSVK